MSRRPRPKKTKQATTPAGPARAKRHRPTWRTGLVLLILVGVSGAGLAAYKRNHDVAHDLSAIGNGIPTVVQVHDPGCSKCQQLKSNVSAAASVVGDKIQFRIAQIRTDRGRSFAYKHKVPHVTLVFFDASGEKLRTIEGITAVDTLKREFRRLAGMKLE
ncbi:MAG: thioredoxin family protein [Gammaproteobacteria bacterium]|nr:thioredoxin family protein [Gammaproteobacteria bacterium]